MAPTLELVFLGESKTVDTDRLADHLQRVFARVGAPQGNPPISLRPEEAIGRLVTEIVFVGDKKIRALNKQFRGEDRPTDVLSFERPHHAPEYPASVVISLETAARQAKDAGWSLDDEVRILASHGLLHVLGFGHR